MIAMFSLAFGDWNFLGTWQLGFGVSRQTMSTRAIVAVAMILGIPASGEDLQRKAKTPRESYPNVDVIYDSVTAPDGKRLRTIITKPRDAKGKLPVIFVAGWLSCDSVA